ncbi:inducible alternative oxidase 2 [Friedmanniomyces endolithicus]|nr:inducible alternative oxidase 2 [Friedmanniomyces endolithicus]KAK0836038.1 inducible alternative oxidase 2 [Friedmanniomyces endolithicus]
MTDPDSSSFAVEKANSLHITGHARNCDNGTVQGEAQGDSNAIDKFLQYLNKGPGPAHVNKVDSKEMGTIDGESGFDR